MAARVETLLKKLSLLDKKLEALRGRVGGPAVAAIDRWRADYSALRFHMQDPSGRPLLLAVVGGTGTGKSTLVNSLLKAKITGTSYRRTFTRGAVAIARDAGEVPTGWLGIKRNVAAANEIPVRGETGALVIAEHKGPLTERLTIIDSTDLDGDNPEHHAEADRIFRWAEAALFLVTPEKYQMNELIPYYRLARRYRLPALFAMNKVEEAIVLEDYARQLRERDWPEAAVHAIPREDAPYQPPPGRDLDALREGLLAFKRPAAAEREEGAACRCADLLDRLRDQIIEPLRARRQAMDRLIQALRTIMAPEPGVDVGPMTRQLQRRMQEQSILYLMGPQRMLERIRQAPTLLSRLPRNMWDFLSGTAGPPGSQPTMAPPPGAARPPDFPALLIDQLTVLQTRIDDILRSNPEAERLLEAVPESYQAAKIDPKEAGRIAEEEMAELKAWLENRWNKTPRDTALLKKFLSLLPGGEKLVQWSEGAPYLLTAALAVTGTFFGRVDLIVIGGYSVATWIGEKLNNEVAQQTRETNRKIGERFSRLAREQVDRAIDWLDRQAPEIAAIEPVEALAAEIAERAEGGGS